MIRKLLTTLFGVFLFSTSSFAQFYPTQHRPPDQNWQQLKTSHFEFIFAKGNETQARELAKVLESQYSSVQEVVGGELNNFPIILNNYNDRSNGFVTPFNFRSEIELPPIKGKSLNPQTGNWLTNVGPHELIHALQFSNIGEYNIPHLVSFFSPDMARMFHSAIPMGMHEGIAVYHETENITKYGGRGNHPFFTNQFNATFNSDQRWSMGQLMQTTSYTRPFGRHYIGGYEFTDWLHSEYGDGITQQALDFYMDFPFLGYGIALRHATGLWPGQLYNDFEAYHKNRFSEANTAHPFKKIDLPYEGPDIRHPKWLSDSNLIFYGSYYNARSGFYTYDLAQNKTHRLITTNSVRDFQYDLSADRSRLVYSYYETDPIYNNTARTELVQYDFTTHQKKQLTKNGRLYAPSYYKDELFALKSHPVKSRLVSINNSNYGEQDTIFAGPNHHIKAVAANPARGQLAIVSNKNGQQALWITERGSIAEQLKQDPNLAFAKGSIFDPEWHPEDNKLLFSADFSGTMQLYEYDLADQQVLQVTDTKFNAFEGSYSPDGARIAFVRQDKNKRLLTILERTAFLNKPVKKELWQKRHIQEATGVSDIISDSIAQASTNWQSGTYSSGVSWLKPRTVVPFADEVSNSSNYQAGVSLHSVNTLSTQSYSADLSYFKNRGWFDLTYQNKTFWPGFKLRAFNEPSYRSATGIGLLGRQERSLALSVPLQVDLNQNIYSTSFYITPEIRRSQLRFFDAGFDNSISDFANIVAGNIYAQFNYRLQQNIRDVQPNTGLILFSEIENYIKGDEITLGSPSNEITFSSPNATALRGGIYGFLAPLKRWNQSLRIGVRGLTQSDPIFNNQTIVSDGFSDFVFPNSRNLLSFDSRYTVPLFYVDDGGLLLPFYLSNIYFVAFSNTVTDPTFTDWYNESRTVFGIGIRTSFQLSNLKLNIGLGFGYEPTRKQTQFFIGDF